MKNGGCRNQVKIFVLGGSQVGKSALTVRYLTRRYIGEYKSHSDLSYRQIFSLDGANVEVEIVDVSNQPEDKTVPTLGAKNSDACVVVYSISDRSSFRAAQEALLALSHSNWLLQPPLPPVGDHYLDNGLTTTTSTTSTTSSSVRKDRLPVLLLGNKKDLEHLRQVATAEGCELARRYCCSLFYEVSAAETETEPDISAIFNQLVREGRSYRLQQDLCNGPGSAGTTTSHNSSTTGHQSARQRKKSVFTINRMLGSLIGRNSMPPELPSSKGLSVANMGTSLPNVTGSFKSVFKKRSV